VERERGKEKGRGEGREGGTCVMALGGMDAPGRIYVRIFNSFLELGEFASGQAPVLVVIEPLDEMDRPILGELELVLQNRRRLGEANVLSPARQHNDVFKSNVAIENEDVDDAEELRVGRVFIFPVHYGWILGSVLNQNRPKQFLADLRTHLKQFSRHYGDTTGQKYLNNFET